MSLGFPAGLWALAALVPLVAAYFLRRRQPPLKVSALFLWRSPDLRAEGGPRLRRFSRELSLLLEALAVLAAALFLADARFGRQAQAREVVIVVDGSLSMSARLPGGSAVAEQVRTRVAELARDERAATLTLVESGPRPRLLAGPREVVSQALAALDGWRPAAPAHDPLPSLVFARELAGPARRIHFLTDGLPSEGTSPPPGVDWLALGRPLDNAALVSAQRRDEGEAATVTVRVANYSGASRALTVTFDAEPASSGGAPARQQQEVQVAPGESRALRATFRGAGVVHASLPDDALAEDGRVTLLPAPLRRVRATVLSGLPAAEVSALRRFLAADRAVSIGGGEEAEEGEVALSFGPRGSSAGVTLGAPGKQRSFVGPFFTRKDHPLLEDVELSGVVWTAGDNPPGRPLVTAGAAVLLAEDDGGAVHLNLELSRSDIQRTPAWPVLLANVMERARARLPGLSRRQLMLGEEVPVALARGERFVLEGPDGSRPVLGVGEVLLPPPRQPGRYRLLRDGKPAGELEVMAIDPRESDLRGRGEGVRAAAGDVTGTADDAAARDSRRPPWLLLALLALVLADFALTARTA